MQIDDKEQTFPHELVVKLFNAKFLDLKLPDTDDQLIRFSENFTKRNINGLISLTDMKLGINFAKTFADIFLKNPCLRVIHLNLSLNLLGDSGVSKIVEAIKHSESLISLDISSNEITSKGVNFTLN